MNLTHSKVLLYGALIFGCGALVGGLSHRLYRSTEVRANVVQPRPASFKARYIEESQRRLNLTEAQVTKLALIMDETRSRMDELNYKVVDPETDRIRNEQIDKVRAILTPEQLPEYEKLRREREERRNKQKKSSR